jgi:transposase
MPRRAKREFTEEFKAEVVKLVRQGDKSLPQIVRDLDLTESTVRIWVQRAQATDPAHSETLAPAERQELEQLRKEVRVLRMERELLKNSPRGCSHLLKQKLAIWYRLRGSEGAAVRFLETIQTR